LVSRRDLPEVSDLLPLTWLEVVHGARIFHRHYVENEVTDYNATREETPEFTTPWERDQFYRENPIDRAIDTYGMDYLRYMAARDYQDPNDVFTDTPEDSAPFKYTEGLAKYPFLAFMVPEVEELEDFNCEQDRFVLESPEMITLCNRYVESLGRRNPFRLSVTRRSVANALKETLNINYEMIRGIDESFPFENLFDEEGNLLTQAEYHDLSDWNQLMKMQNLNEHFYSLFPQFTDQEQRFVEIMNRRENFVFWTSLAGAIGLGVACGFIGNFWGAAGCLAVAGLGFNMVFYAQAYRAYEDNFGMYFAMDVLQESEGELLSLIEFGTLESSLQNLYLEKIFLGIGTGIGEVLSRARHLRRLAQ
jgi:hypothetical protein